MCKKEVMDFDFLKKVVSINKNIGSRVEREDNCLIEFWGSL